MVKALSHGSGRLPSPTFRGSDLRQPGLPADGKFASSAALLSWEGDSLDAKLCLISFPSIQAVLKFCKSSTILGALEDIDALDPESLYGVICHRSSASNEKLNFLQTHRFQVAGRTVTPPSNKVSDTVPEVTAVPAERGRDIVTADRTASPSNKKRHVIRSEILTKSASMEPIRASTRDANFKFDFEEAGKGSKKRYQKQLSAMDKVHETSGKHHSKYGNGTRDLDDDDIGTLYQQTQSMQRERFNWNYGRLSQRQEWRSDRLKDPFRWGKDDRDSSKQRVKEHQRHHYQDGERDKGWKSLATEGDQHRNQDKPRHKEREKSLKDSVTEDSKLKRPIEKSLASSKNKPSFLHRVSPDRDSGKLNKKRAREGEKEHVVSVKRTRELEVTASLRPEQLMRDTSRDMKCKPEIEQIEDHSQQKETVLIGKPGFLKSDKESHTLDEGMSNHGKFDDVVGAITMDTHVLDEKIVKPLSVDDITRVTNEPSAASVSILGECEINTSPNLLIVSSKKTGPAEDGAPSKSDETLGDSLLDKVKGEKEETGVEFFLDIMDKETRTWLLSKQNTIYLQEEYGVHTTIRPDLSNCDVDPKTDSQTGPLHVKISVLQSEPCDAAEDKWFLDQAATMVKSIASRGVFIKCLWYEGPVQIHPGDGAPSVPVIVKKIKGEDGKNLERMQDETGVMIGVVLRKSGTGGPHDMEPLSRPRFIGLRLKCIRRKGLLEAMKEAEVLLECVADHFSKELATHIATHIVDLQAPAMHSNESMSNQGSPSALTMATKELFPNMPVKAEGLHDSPGSCKLDEVAFSASLQDVDSKTSLPKEEPEVSLPVEQEEASRPLYVSNLSDHLTPIKIRNIFENVLKEKLEPSADFDCVSELVADVTYTPDKFCASVVLANDGLLNAALKLYAEDKTVFQGMNVELGPSEQPRPFSRNRDSVSGEHGKAAILTKNENESSGRRQGAADNDSDSDWSHDQWYAENVGTRTGAFPGRPRPLFLSELMRNASVPAIKQLFEDIITTYIGPTLVSAGGRQLVLDVRYVPSRGCAFVDLATPELVDFMLDLHSRRPDVFMNMKMELGRKAVPYSTEEDGGGRLNIRRDLVHGKSHFNSQAYGYRLSLASRKKPNGSFDLEDSDKGDDLLWLSARMKKQRSDPEKTIYADRLPENPSEGMIRKIFERVLLQKLTQEEVEGLGEHMITEVRHIPTKYCAFVVFATEELTRKVLHLYNQDEDAFDSMRLKPHFHSRMEDLYKDEAQEIDEIIHTSSIRERMDNLDNDNARPRQFELHDSRTRSAAHRAITASAFREVDRRRSVYVDKIPEDLSESTMTEMFEKVFWQKKHGYDGPMVSQVAYFRDKFDPSKLCAFVEVKTEDGTQDLVDFYNSNQDAFQGMRVRPGFKYSS
eukprot:c23805_g2_i1 orf=1426-5607(+)